MTRSLLPPRGIFVPTGILYDKEIPPAVRDTWAQLRGLAYGQHETPVLSVKMLSEILEKSQSTIYEHMRLLRLRGTLRWYPAGSSEIRVVFPVDADLSENLEKLDPLLIPNPKTPPTNGSKKRGSLSEKPESRKMPADILKAFVSTLAGIYVVDMRLNYGRLAKEAKQLHEAGYTSEQVQSLYFPCKNGLRSAWYTHDWRGQKGEVPAMGVIPQTIAKLMDPPEEIALEKKNGKKGSQKVNDFRRYNIPGEDGDDVP